MARALLGFILGLTISAFAVEKHQDGSVTWTRDELEIITANWYNTQYTLQAQAERIRDLEKEIDKINKSKCI